MSVEPPKWNDQKKSDGTIIEDNGQKVRNTCYQWRNVISTEGFSQGVHSWIVEFKGDSGGYYNFRIVCDPHNHETSTGKMWLLFQGICNEKRQSSDYNKSDIKNCSAALYFGFG